MKRWLAGFGFVWWLFCAVATLFGYVVAPVTVASGFLCAAMWMGILAFKPEDEMEKLARYAAEKSEYERLKRKFEGQG